MAVPERVLITGASGFVGRNLLQVLVAEPCELFALVRSEESAAAVQALVPRAIAVRGDLGDAASVTAAVRLARPSVCIHLAWYVVPGAYWESMENLTMLTATLHLFRACQANGCDRFLGIGTCAEYDTRAGVLSEESTLRPTSLYAAAKLSCAMLLQQLGRSTNVGCAWARLFYQYGPWEDGRRLVPLVITRLLAGETVDLTGGTQLRDYLHIRDVARALWTIACADATGPLNIGSGAVVSIRSIAERIGAILGREQFLRFGLVPTREDEPAIIGADSSRLRSLGWQPTMSLDAGLRETVRWWKQAIAGSCGG